jgi:hypothetical protein
MVYYRHILAEFLIGCSEERLYLGLMKPNEEKFHERLRLVIDALGTRREAAEIAGVSLDAVVRYLRGENQPGFLIVGRLCEAAKMSMHWLATGQGKPALNDNKDPLPIASGFPVLGFAETKETGWYAPQNSTLQTTLDMNDPNAFATVVHGQGLIPEGLQPGFMCICSPMMKPLAGDIVHLKRFDGLCALRLFLREEGEWLVLKSYTDADAKGSQRSFEDKVKRSTISQMSPVVFVKRKL